MQYSKSMTSLAGLALLIMSGTSSANDLSKVYSLAEQNDPQFRATRAQFEAETEAPYQAWGAMMPQVSGSLYKSDTSSETTNSGATTISDYSSDGYSLNLSQTIYDHAKSNSLQVVRQYCGHGVGFSQHEEPQIPNYVSSGPNPRLKPGMILALEPMLNRGDWQVRLLEDKWTVITADRSDSAHFEHTIAVHKDHTEILTLHHSLERV